MILLEIAHIVVLLFMFTWTFLSFRTSNRKHTNYWSIQLVIDTILGLLVIACFWFNREFKVIPIQGGYTEFSILVFIGFSAYLTRKYLIKNQPILNHILSIFIGVLFWMSICAILKLYYVSLLVLFPLFGFMIAAPYLTALLSLSDLLHHNPSGFRTTVSFSIGGGLGFTLFFAVISNLWTAQSWDFLDFLIELPTHTHFY